MLVKYAAARVACLADGWDLGNHQPIGLGDMSEADGSIPGTSIGEPGRPDNTHAGFLTRPLPEGAVRRLPIGGCDHGSHKGYSDVPRVRETGFVR